MAGKKITYLFGAGASYNAVPILNSLSDLMVKSGEYLQINSPQIFGGRKRGDDDYLFENFKTFTNDLIELGKKAEEYGTLDTYAKKLFLNSEQEELKKLKFLVSIFFATWHGYLNEYFPLKEKTLNADEVQYQQIDSRYKSLISNFLYRNHNSTNPLLDENLNFITWNYDYQLESALNLFTKTKLDLSTLNLSYPFLPLSDNHEDMKITHLNGVANFWIKDKELALAMLSENSFSDSKLLSRKIGELYKTENFEKVSTFINYSWDNEHDKISYAEKLLKQTDILVIIGYSFPTFNRAIDAKLLSGEDNSFDRIIYQDPNSSKEILQLFNIKFRNTVKSALSDAEQLHILKDTDQFYIPPEYFPQGAKVVEKKRRLGSSPS